MHVERLTLQNFRCFEHRAFDLHPGFTLLVGANATGKTAILEGLAVALGAPLMSVPHAPARTIRPTEVRRTWRRVGETWGFREHYPTRVVARGAINGAVAEWERELRTPKSRTTRVGAKEVRREMDELVLRSQDDDQTLFPFVGYYGTGRLWHEQSLVTKAPLSPATPASRYSGYQHCLNPSSSARHLVAWIKRWALAQAQRKHSLTTLQAVLDAIANCVEDAVEADFDFEQDDIVLEFPTGFRTPFSLLSDGQRSVAATVGDIALRCAIINPHLRGGARLNTPGVVLIDELDQHLHPRWQRRAIGDLQGTFPHLQFVATSHSPFIIQSVEQGHVINLDDDDVHRPGRSPQSIEDIVENVMGVEQPQRSRRFQQMVKAAEEYLQALEGASSAVDSGRLDQLRERLDSLEEPFADNPGYLAFLRLQRSQAFKTLQDRDLQYLE
ncbi:MAG: AAA family ATPase [Acidobacteriota bacterium]|nr:AAA family ATPase [Acidobacteriota bacterium]MDE3264391.1 AAA family ATPase [Acidobacteriota bacterium]